MNVEQVSGVGLLGEASVPGWVRLGVFVAAVVGYLEAGRRTAKWCAYRIGLMDPDMLPIFKLEPRGKDTVKPALSKGDVCDLVLALCLPFWPIVWCVYGDRRLFRYFHQGVVGAYEDGLTNLQPPQNNDKVHDLKS